MKELDYSKMLPVYHEDYHGPVEISCCHTFLGFDDPTILPGGVVDKLVEWRRFVMVVAEVYLSRFYARHR